MYCDRALYNDDVDPETFSRHASEQVSIPDQNRYTPLALHNQGEIRRQLSIDNRLSCDDAPHADVDPVTH